ncbi:endonuclease [Dokdonella immobilis]|uniref:Ig-like domain-containing protein n=1 Tax=Dokdonella immobilis TaxID=578942 RepID=A0A1I4Y2F9_9GAMM|nr:endonuclease [Dokdonella immobilis]SFN32264.1 Ig-like domain-containing protein [Dokdonella immobilis]
MHPRSGATRVLASLFLFALAPAALAQFVPLVGGTAPVQDFDTLAVTGSSSTLPDGWYLAESGSNANTSYTASNGAVNSGDTYSFGANGNNERAFGSLLSGSVTPTIGAQLRNDTGIALGEIAVSYTGEQWRLGTTGRSDTLLFQYSLDATSLTDAAATWVPVSTLDFSSPTTTGSTGALDGNLAANRSERSDSITGINLAAGASLWVRWVDTNASGADDGLAIDDIGFSVAGDPPADVPPTVLSTTPGNNAVDVPLASTLVVSFSEAVTVTEPWYSISCADSGSHTATQTGGPTSYTLTPSPGFAANEVCTWTILATGVLDQDGTPDAMAADTVVEFTTFDPGSLPAPSVISTQPADNATHVPLASDVRVSFSEAVTTTPGAFELACDSAPIGLAESGSGAQRTLTPDSLLPANGQCTFTIIAEHVRNAGDIAMEQSLAVHFTVGDGSTSGYYGQVNTSSAEQLRCTLHLTIRGHTAYPYSGSGTNTWTILETAQAAPGNPNQILDVYKNRLYTAISDRAGTGSGVTYNREHTWPNSLGFPSQTGNLGLPNAPYTDTHMLYLSDTQWNADRGNSPYGNCPVAASCGERTTEANFGFGGGSGVYPGNSNWVNNNTFETWNHRKGDVARAVMYMAIRYEGGTDPTSGQAEPNLELTDNRSLIVGSSNYNVPAYMGLLSDLLAWHAADPPDAEELARNDVIQTFQGNRNPFIDHPEWATQALFQSSNPATCEPLGNDLIFVNGFDTAAPPTMH